MSVTTLPAATEVTGLPDEVIAIVVVVVFGDVDEAPTLTTREVLDDSDPEVPVMVTVAFPVVAVLFAVKVRVLDPGVIGFEENAAATPLGRPAAERSTLPLNPFCGVTITVDFPVPPARRLTVLGAPINVKPGVLIVR